MRVPGLLVGIICLAKGFTKYKYTWFYPYQVKSAKYIYQNYYPDKSLNIKKMHCLTKSTTMSTNKDCTHLWCDQYHHLDHWWTHWHFKTFMTNIGYFRHFSLVIIIWVFEPNILEVGAHFGIKQKSFFPPWRLGKRGRGRGESSIWHSGQQAWTSILTCYKNFHKESCDEFCEASWIWTLNLFWTNSPPNKFHMWSKQRSLGRREIKFVMLDILEVCFWSLEQIWP